MYIAHSLIITGTHTQLSRHLKERWVRCLIIEPMRRCCINVGSPRSKSLQSSSDCRPGEVVSALLSKQFSILTTLMLHLTMKTRVGGRQRPVSLSPYLIFNIWFDKYNQRTKNEGELACLGARPRPFPTIVLKYLTLSHLTNLPFNTFLYFLRNSL